LTQINHVKYGDPIDIYEMVNSPWGVIPAWKASTLATGTMGCLDAYMQEFQAQFNALRTDAVSASSLDEREANLVARETALAINVAQFMDFVCKASVLFDRLEHRADRARFDEEPLTSPPGDPSLDQSDLPEPVQSDLPEPVLEVPTTGDSEDLSGEFLHLTAPLSVDDETEFALPEDKLPVPPVAQPIACEFDTEEEKLNGN
jgi:hypothetical protein